MKAGKSWNISSIYRTFHLNRQAVVLFQHTEYKIKYLENQSWNISTRRAPSGRYSNFRDLSLKIIL